MMHHLEPNQDLSKTHTPFFDAHIIAQTALAFRIKVHNRKGAQTTVWVPKSRCSFEMIPVKDSTASRIKYYAPNFFIK